MQDTKEIEFDAVADKGEVVEYAISEHVEYAGVHSGDATMIFPAQHIYFSTVRQIKKVSQKIAKELNISGPFNIQFLAKNQYWVLICLQQVRWAVWATTSTRHCSMPSSLRAIVCLSRAC